MSNVRTRPQKTKETKEQFVEELLKPPQKPNFPRSQSLVDVLSVFRDNALVTKHNYMVMALEVHGEDDTLQTDADVQSYYAALADLFRKLNFSYQICIYPRRQRIDAVIEKYRKYETEWEQRRALATSFASCYPIFLKRAFRYCVDAIPKRPTLAELEAIFTESCSCFGCGEGIKPMKFDDFNFVPGELPNTILSFADFADFVRETIQEGLQQNGIDQTWLNNLKQKLGEVPDEVINEFYTDLMRITGGLALKNEVQNAWLSTPEEHVSSLYPHVDSLFQQAGASLKELEESIPGIAEELLLAIARAAAHMRNVMQQTETAIGNYVNASIEAIDRILSYLIGRGSLLEAQALNREQMIRSVLFIVTAPIGLIPSRATLSQSAMESTYKILQERCSIIAAGLNAVGLRATQLQAKELLDYIKNIYNKDVIWRVNTEDRLGN